MAKQIHVAGPVLVKAGFPTSLSEVGYTQEGADIRFETHMMDVPGDENGGSEGPPIDIVHLGDTARIRLELTKYDETIVKQITARITGATPGTIPDAGTLLFQDIKYQRICLVGTNPVTSVKTVYNFLRAVCREPVEVNKGSKFSRCMLEITAYRDPVTRVLYNTSDA